jgi:exonuclease SbcC
MRPRSLLMENFGPYREEAVVDFDRLGPVFLIWGKTGSGKTSIFDAMTYALYGEVAGSRSGLERQLWSQYAKPGEKPRVEFEFDLGGQAWRVARTPPHRKIGRGGEEREVPAEAACWRLEDGVWSLVGDKIGEVDSAIRRGLGLSVDEFSKIVLLPQGEFQRFLEMDSTARVGILEKLFPVELHDAVTELARQGAKSASEELKRIDGELERLRKEAREAGFEAEGEEGQKDREARLAEVASLEARRGLALAAFVGAEKALASGLEEGRKAEAARAAEALLAGLEASSEAALARKAQAEAGRRAARVLPALDSAARAAEALAAEAAALAGRRADLEALEAGRAGALAARDRAAAAEAGRSSIDREIGEAQKALESWKKAAEAEVALGAAARKEAATKAVLDAAVAEEARVREMAAGQELSPEEEEAVTQSWEKAREGFEAAKLLEARAIAYGTKRAGAEELAVAEAAAEEKLRETEAALALCLEERDHDEARRLASRLREGEACPVCGSLEHPSPARASHPEGRSGADGLSPAEDRIANLSLAKDAAMARLAEARESRKALERELAALLEAADPATGLPMAEEARRLRQEAEGRAQEAAQAFRGLGERRKARAQAATALEESRGRREEAAKAWADATAALRAVEAGREAARAHAGGNDPGPRLEELRARHRTLEEEGRKALELATTWEKDHKSAEIRVAESASRLPVLESEALRLEEASALALRDNGFASAAEARAAALGLRELATLEGEVAEWERKVLEARVAAREAGRAAGEGPPPDVEALRKDLEAARSAFDEAQAVFDAAKEGLARRERMAGDLSRRMRERSELAERSSRLAGLSALLSGDLAGRRLPFKNYVLGLYFREVVQGASIRLGQMTEGRYGLAADEGSASGRGRIGLDLAVLDSFTGRSRPAGTLSGGERFLTSLALALSLADTIRSRSGGASLDAVFIDEGFGSLDEEALDRAVAALDRARGARMIGIVSHVPELRSRIGSRIEVEKGRRGSRLSIVQ